MLWDTQSAVQRAARTPATGLPVEMGMEALTAGYRFTVDEERSTSLESALWDEYDAYLDQVEQRTGKRLQNPIGYAPREKQPGMTGQLGAQVRLRREQAPLGDPVTGMPGFEAQLAKLRETTPDLPEPPTAGQLLDRITNRLGMARERYEDLQSRMSTGGSVASFVGSMGGLATDPLVAATMPFGAGASRPLVAKMLIEAGIAGASELLVQPYVLRGKEAIDSPYSAADAAANVLAAAGLGAAFPAAGALLHGLGSKGARALGRAFDRERPVVRAATQTERAALADLERAFTAEESSPAPVADLPAHLDALERETAVVRETGVPSGAVPEVPIEPTRAAEVEADMRLDDVTEAEIGALAREDADLGRAMEVMESIRVYHGSPHRFERFSMDAIGTGEGAQAFGHGLYFAENQKIAEHYRHVLGGKNPMNVSFGGREIDLQAEGVDSLVAARVKKYYRDDIDAAVEDYRAFLGGAEAAAREGGDAARLAQVLDERKALDEAAAQGIEIKPPGSLYSVDLNVSRDELLDWDKPLSEQPAKVREALERAGYQADDRSGEEFIREIEGRDSGHGQAVMGASEILPDLGIKGIQFLDATSRDAGEGSRNIVMFSDEAIHIREINGAPVPDPAEAAKDLAAFTGSRAEDAILTADVERALGAKPPPEPTPDAPKPAEPPKPILDPELAKMEVPVAETLDGAETRTAADLLDELEREQKTLDAMSSCAAPMPMPKGPKP